MLFQKKRNEEETFQSNLIALVEDEFGKLKESNRKISEGLNQCIIGIRSIQRMSGIPEEEKII